jgi:hypothetical protein
VAPLYATENLVERGLLDALDLSANYPFFLPKAILDCGFRTMTIDIPN